MKKKVSHNLKCVMTHLNPVLTDQKIRNKVALFFWCYSLTVYQESSSLTPTMAQPVIDKYKHHRPDCLPAI